MEEERDQVKPYMIEHLQELMEDVESYGWEPLRAYHAAWFQKMEQERVSWADVEKKMKFRKMLVWHCLSNPP